MIFVDKNQLPKLEKVMLQTGHIFRLVPASKHETRANTNANLPFSITVFVTIN